MSGVLGALLSGGSGRGVKSVESVFKRIDGIFVSLSSLSALFVLTAGLSQMEITMDAVMLLCSSSFFSLGALNYIFRQVDYQDALAFAAMGFIPVFGRYVCFSGYVFQPLSSFWDLSTLNDILYTLGAQILTAVSEESFRATMLNLFKLLPKKAEWIRYGAANAAWVAYHFFRHPFDWAYCAWLACFCAPVFTYCLEKHGLGSACLAHMICNLVG